MGYEKPANALGRLSACLVFLPGLLLPAQAPQDRNASPTSDGSLQFEVATIKVHDPSAVLGVGVHISPGGRIRIIGVGFKTLVEIALNRPLWAISESDASIEKVNYDLDAVPPENLRASVTNLKHTWYTIADERLRQMLTALLIERFQLRFHRETRIGTVYLLQRSNKPLRLVPSQRERRNEKGEDISPGFGSIGLAGNWDITDASMTQLANFASENILHVPVQDETHLDGYFHYRSPTDVDMSQPGVQESSFIGFVSEMGLRLKKSSGPVETIVIDHVEKPSEN